MYLVKYMYIIVYQCLLVIEKSMHLPLMFQKAMFEVEDLSKKRKIKAAKAVTKTCTEKQQLFSFFRYQCFKWIKIVLAGG